MSKASRERERIRNEKYGRSKPSRVLKKSNIVKYGDKEVEGLPRFVIPIWEMSYFMELERMNSEGELQKLLGNCSPDVDLFGPYLEKFMFTNTDLHFEKYVLDEINENQDKIMDLEQILFSLDTIYHWCGRKAMESSDWPSTDWCKNACKAFERMIHYLWDVVRTKPFAQQFYTEMN